jgi:hypothetical protein
MTRINKVRSVKISNDRADIGPVIFLRFGKIIATDEIYPKSQYIYNFTVTFRKIPQ